MPVANRTRSTWTVKPDVARSSLDVSIQIKDKDKKSLSTFSPIHTKSMHLLAIGPGLTLAAHEHPSLKNGKFEATVPLPGSGKYVLFDEYDPAGALPQTMDRKVVSVGGSGFAKPSWDFTTRTKTAEGLTFKMTSANLMSGMPMPITVQVLGANGRPALLKDWLAAKGHAFATQEGAPKLYHFHPAQPGNGGGHGGHGGGGTPASGEITFHAAIDKAGAYRVFVQVMKQGATKPTTVSFDVNAT